MFVESEESEIIDESNGILERHHRGVSHMVHFSVAEAGFDSMHVEQVQLPLVEVGGLIATADQSKAATGGDATLFVDGLASGF